MLRAAILAFLTISVFYFAHGQSQSLLSSGTWFKIGVTRGGVYKMDFDYLKANGVDIQGAVSSKIQLYGNGGGTLPQLNSKDRPDGLLENAILVSDGGDGTFDKSDFIMFYGDSPDPVSFNRKTHRFDYTDNVYSDTTFYFLTWGKIEGKRIQTSDAPQGTASNQKVYRLDYHDLNEFNLLKSGRDWYGLNFTSSKRIHNISIPVPLFSQDATHQLEVSVMASSIKEESTFDLKINDLAIGQLVVRGRADAEGLSRAYEDSEFYTLTRAEKNQEINCRLDFKSNYGGAYGFLDVLIFTTHTGLIYSDQAYLFSTDTTGTPGDVQISNYGDQLDLWDVTDPITPQRVPVSGNGKFLSSPNTIQDFILFGPEDVLQPIKMRKLSNQNLLSTPSVDLMIITHPMFQTEAERLADHRRAYSGLAVSVVNVNDIFNEFSSGMLDVTAIRDFIRSVWIKGDLSAVLMFGDASYDYKNRVKNNTNFVPTYQSVHSLSYVFSYCSDDYFTFMEEDEGEWPDDLSQVHTMDVSIGRLPVRTPEEASVVVDKLIYYDLELEMGSWRSRLLFSSDDGDSNLHNEYSERLAERIETNLGFIISDKLFIDDFAQPNQYSVAAAQEYERLIHSGQLISNYTGHGNQDQLSSEGLVSTDRIKNWTNLNRLSFMVAATCDFAVFDNPAFLSAGEQVMVEQEGGAIGVITSTRPVLSNTNFLLNQNFMDQVFEKENGRYSTIGEIFRKVKNDSYRGASNKSYVLIGDPTMYLAAPNNQVVIDSVLNDAGVKMDSFPAFIPLKVYGSVLMPDSSLMDAFSGQVEVIFYDAPSQKLTLGQDNDPFPYMDRNSLLFNGKASVSGGNFELDILIPESNAGVTENAKVVLYAANQETRIDAAGAVGSVKVDYGGYLTDTQQPEMQIFVGDTLFEDGNSVSANAKLFVHLKDQSGINLSIANAQTRLQGTLNDETFSLNEYYQADVDTYQSGWVSYPLNRLSAGKYGLSVQASDLAGNVTSKTVTFSVLRTSQLPINDFKTYPNPAVSDNDVKFSFIHDKPNDEIRITYSIFSLTGETVYEGYLEIPNATATVTIDGWTVEERNAGNIEAGIYIYDMNITALYNGASARKKGRIVIQ